MLSKRIVLSKKPFSNFLYTVALHFRILQNFKHPSSSSPLNSTLLNTLPSSSSREGGALGGASHMAQPRASLYLNPALVISTIQGKFYR